MSMAQRVEEYLSPVKEILKPIHGLPDMFARCFLNTLESTSCKAPDGGVFVITGDIEAMWLRDSTEQALHYLRFAAKDQELAAWLEELIARQSQLVLEDPYANAFNMGPTNRHGYQDWPEAGPWVWERKYELDSLCHVLLLAVRYHQATGKTAFMNAAFFKAVETILNVITLEQRHEECSAYRFQRKQCPPSDTLTNFGQGEPVGYTGMSWSGFRPSDDACRYGYLIPANLFAASVLERLAPVLDGAGETALADRCRILGQGLRKGVEQWGCVKTERFGEIYAFETDGLGHYVLMDDANIPSLLSLPYLGVCETDDSRYLRTRAFVLSEENPQFFVGKAGKGVGSPHTPQNAIWPIGLCVQGLTATTADERVEVLETLLTSHAGTARMHESFDKDQPEKYTRAWFAWANSMFGELVMRMYELGELEHAVEQIAAKGIKDIKESKVLTI